MIATDKKAAGTAILFVVLLLVVFTTVIAYIQTVDIADVPEAYRPHWSLIASFFTSGLGAFLVAISWNVYGYLAAYYKSGKVEQYDTNKLYMTLAKFAAFFTTIDSVMAIAELTFGKYPEFWLISIILKAVFITVIAIISELKRLQAPPSVEIPTPAVT